jgi:hypothetical protein
MTPSLARVCAIAVLALHLAADAAEGTSGYKSTPLIPGTPWHVHDSDRPQPRIVTPGAAFSQMAPAPADGTVLFDGTDLSRWTGTADRASWRLEGSFVEVVPGTGSIRTRERFADFQLHLEFATPAQVAGDGQGRGNSGILFNGMYEIQLLDSFGNTTYPDGQAGAIYGQSPPLANASRRPGEWQTMDIIFESPRWGADERLLKKANVTVMQNGVILHHRKELQGTTPHQANGNYDKPHAPEVFIELQDHGDRVRFRNIWLRELGSYDTP